MSHEIKDNIYYIYGSNDAVLLTIKLANTCAEDQLIIETAKEVFVGPISLLSFSIDKH